MSIPAAQAAGPTDSRRGVPPLINRSGGPVMTKVKNYLVFWTGGNKNAFDKKYVELLQRWQKDARHLTVFKSTTQYTQADGRHPTDTTYGATYTVNTRFPQNAACANMCVGSLDIGQIALTTAAKHKIKPGMGTIVYVYTPKNVRWCDSVEPDSTECDEDREGDFAGLCGFHRADGGLDKPLIFVYVNYPDSSCYTSDGSQRFPNNLAADAAVNVTSHFQFEAITDPLFTSWREDNDDVVENASECEGIFGPVLPGKKGNSYYGGHTYDVQAQASNADEGCVVGSRPDGF